MVPQHVERRQRTRFQVSEPVAKPDGKGGDVIIHQEMANQSEIRNFAWGHFRSPARRHVFEGADDSVPKKLNQGIVSIHLSVVQEMQPLFPLKPSVALQPSVSQVILDVKIKMGERGKAQRSDMHDKHIEGHHCVDAKRQ